MRRQHRLLVSLGLALFGAPVSASAQTLSPTPGASATEGTLRAADGLQIFYRTVGSGRDTLIFLHGGPATGLREGYDLEALAGAGYTIIMYDQVGAGQSELASQASRLTLQKHVADLEAVRRHFRLGRFSLAGFGWGAAIALHYALATPRGVERMILLSPMAPSGLQYVKRLLLMDAQRTPEVERRLRSIDSLWAVAGDTLLSDLCRESQELSRPMYQEGGPGSRTAGGDTCDYPPQVLRHRRLARMAALGALGAEYDFSAALRRVTIPVLVVEGERSRVSLEGSRLWAGLPADGRLLLVPGAGHRSWLDRPTEVTQALRRFLEGQWPEGSRKVAPE